MSFTPPSDVLLSVDKLALFYPLHQVTTFRDACISLIKNPRRFITEGKSRFMALEDISFSMQRGERIGLLGANGSGKSSLCRAIAGRCGRLPSITTHGNVRALFGSSVSCYPELSGVENAKLLAALLYPKLGPEALREVVRESLEFSELGERSHRPLKYFSDGMKVRLFLSLASSLPTDLLILDEAFSGADLFFSRKIAERMKRLFEKCGGVLLVSHSMDQIREVCTKTLVIKEGKVAFFGAVDGGIEYFGNSKAC